MLPVNPKRAAKPVGMKTQAQSSPGAANAAATQKEGPQHPVTPATLVADELELLCTVPKTQGLPQVPGTPATMGQAGRQPQK